MIIFCYIKNPRFIRVTGCHYISAIPQALCRTSKNAFQVPSFFLISCFVFVFLTEFWKCLKFNWFPQDLSSCYLCGFVPPFFIFLRSIQRDEPPLLVGMQGRRVQQCVFSPIFRNFQILAQVLMSLSVWFFNCSYNTGFCFSYYWISCEWEWQPQLPPAMMASLYLL